MMTECPPYDEWKLNKTNDSNAIEACRNLAWSLTQPALSRAIAFEE